MQRLATSFAVCAIVILAFGIVIPRFVKDSGISLTLNRTSYVIPNPALCYGAGFVMAFFACVYSGLWPASWSTTAAGWHFTVSISLMICFFGFLITSDRLSQVRPSAQVDFTMVAILTVVPVMFTALQIGFGLDALRRCLPLLIRNPQ